ncbi:MULTISPECIES: rhodanese-like domain-containing protein [Anaerolinea]|uniref:rhodanese-like domain-containing protein n=1 Tax=Anaerolinea TaxID=233189 RepID=UPI002621E171|nr:rhodanese-like domain-containing protein [Anaerolinea thermophila]
MKSSQPKKRKPSHLSPMVLLLGGTGLILIGLLMWLVFNPPSNPTITATPDLGIPFANIPRISLEDAKKAFDTQSAIFVDVRDSNSYAQQHIKGAINIPLGVLESRLNELPKDQWIILYCT